MITVSLLKWLHKDFPHSILLMFSMRCLTVTTQLHTGIMSYGCYSISFLRSPWSPENIVFSLCTEDNILSSCVHKCVICCEHKMIILCTRDNNLCARDNISCSQGKKKIFFCHFRGFVVFWLFLWLQQHAAVSLKGNELGIPRIYLSGICNIAYRHHESLTPLSVCRRVMWTNIFCQTLSCRQDKRGRKHPFRKYSHCWDIIVLPALCDLMHVGLIGKIPLWTSSVSRHLFTVDIQSVDTSEI